MVAAMVDFISRKCAKASGQAHYFTGIPCKNGHISERITVDCKCLECRRAIDRDYARRWRAANPGKMAVVSKQWRLKNPEKFKAGRARWLAANPDKVKASNKRWGAAHRKNLVDATKRWQARNPDKRRAYGANRRARERMASGTHTATEVARIAAAQRQRCAWCRVDLKNVVRHVDHIVPLCRGGENSRRNLQLLCQPCNQRKAMRDPVDFARLEGRLL